MTGSDGEGYYFGYFIEEEDGGWFPENVGSCEGNSITLQGEWVEVVKCPSRFDVIDWPV